MHERTTIRNSIKTLMETLFDPASSVKVGAEAVNVHSGYRPPLDTAEMPGIILYFYDDKAHDLDDIHSARNSNLAVEIYVKESADTDADIDYVSEHIESTLYQNRNITEIEKIEYKGYNRILDTSDKPLPGRLTLHYSVQYSVTWPTANTGVDFNTANADIDATNIQVDMTQL